MVGDVDEQPVLRRQLRLRGAVALGVGGTIGGGIFVLVGTAAGATGPATPIAFALAFCCALLIALPYAELSCRYPRAGGGYAFVSAVLPRPWPFVMGWVFWGSYVFMSGFITLGFGGYLHALTGVPTRVGAVGVIVATTLLNLRGMRASSAVQSAVVGLAVATLAVFAGLGATHVRADRFTPFLPHGVSGILAASLLAFLSYAGFDMVAAAGEEVESPERTLPRAIIATLLVVLGLYVAVAIVSVGVLPWQDLGASSAPLSDAVASFSGSAGRHLLAGAAAFTTGATCNAVVVVMSRIAFAMSRDGLAPRALSNVGARTNAPWAAVLCSGGAVAATALTLSVKQTAGIGGFLYVLHFVLPLITLIVLRRRGGTSPGFRTPAAPVVLTLALAICAVFLASTGWRVTLAGVSWVAVGYAAYTTLTRRQRSQLLLAAPDGATADDRSDDLLNVPQGVGVDDAPERR